MNTTEIVNWNTTNPFLIKGALPVFVFNPFNTKAGLNDDKYDDKYMDG